MTNLADTPPAVQVAWAGAADIVLLCGSPELESQTEYVVFLCGGQARRLGAFPVTQLPPTWSGRFTMLGGESLVTIVAQPQARATAPAAPVVRVLLREGALETTTMEQSGQAHEALFLDLMPTGGPGDMVGPALVLYDGTNHTVWQGSLPEGARLESGRPYDIKRVSAGPELVACSLVDTRGPDPPRRGGLGLVRLSRQTQLSWDDVTLLPPVPSVLSGCPEPLLRADSVFPALADSEGTCLYQTRLHAYHEPEELCVRALVRRSHSGILRVVDLRATYHTSGDNRHDYLWQADEDGALQEVHNSGWLSSVTGGVSRELEPACSSSGDRVAYVKGRELWVAEGWAP